MEWTLKLPTSVMLAMACVSCATHAQRGEALLSFDFERSTEGWVGYPDTAKVRITREARDVKVGKGALELTYRVAPDQYGTALVPIKEGALARMGSLRFYLKTDVATTVAVALTEKKPNGGDYAA